MAPRLLTIEQVRDRVRWNGKPISRQQVYHYLERVGDKPQYGHKCGDGGYRVRLVPLATAGLIEKMQTAIHWKC
jgi:hypothetical protein